MASVLQANKLITEWLADDPSAEITTIEKSVDGRVTIEEISDSLREYANLFKAGYSSPAQTLTLHRAYPDNPLYAETVKEQDLLQKDPNVVGGPASVEMIDREGHLITTNALNKAFTNYMKNPMTRNVMVMHSDIQVGWALPAYISKSGQIYKSGIGDNTLFFITELRDDTKISKRVVEEIKKSRMKSYSIAGSAIRTENVSGNMFKGEPPYMRVDELELAEVTICEKGVNQGAGFDIIKGSRPTKSCADESCFISKNEDHSHKQETQTMSFDEYKNLLTSRDGKSFAKMFSEYTYVYKGKKDADYEYINKARSDANKAKRREALRPNRNLQERRKLAGTKAQWRGATGDPKIGRGLDDTEHAGRGGRERAAPSAEWHSETYENNPRIGYNPKASEGERGSEEEKNPFWHENDPTSRYTGESGNREDYQGVTPTSASVRIMRDKSKKVRGERAATKTPRQQRIASKMPQAMANAASRKRSETSRRKFESESATRAAEQKANQFDTWDKQKRQRVAETGKQAPDGGKDLRTTMEQWGADKKKSLLSILLNQHTEQGASPTMSNLFKADPPEGLEEKIQEGIASGQHDADHWEEYKASKKDADSFGSYAPKPGPELAARRSATEAAGAQRRESYYNSDVGRKKRWDTHKANSSAALKEHFGIDLNELQESDPDLHARLGEGARNRHREIEAKKQEYYNKKQSNTDSETKKAMKSDMLHTLLGLRR